jgi:hypothetical protein
MELILAELPPEAIFLEKLHLLAGNPLGYIAFLVVLAAWWLRAYVRRTEVHLKSLDKLPNPDRLPALQIIVLGLPKRLTANHLEVFRRRYTLIAYAATLLSVLVLAGLVVHYWSLDESEINRRLKLIEEGIRPPPPPPPEKKMGAAGDWLYDRYIRLRVTHRLKGELIAGRPYELSVDLENRTSMDVFINRIEAQCFSPAAAERFGNSSALTHTSSFETTFALPPNSTRSVKLPLNQILPLTCTISVHHNLAGRESSFRIDPCGEVVEMTGARRLSQSTIYRGIDALVAIDAARAKAKEWADDVSMVAAFPGNHTTGLDVPSGLKFKDVQDWIVTLQSKSKGSFMAHVSHDKVAAGPVDAKDSLEEWRPAPWPVIGNQEALDSANSGGLLWGDWDNLSLNVVKVESEWVPAWFLCYRGSDSLPIVIDATTGDQLLPSRGTDGGFKRVKGSLKRIKKVGGSSAFHAGRDTSTDAKSAGSVSVAADSGKNRWQDGPGSKGGRPEA